MIKYETSLSEAKQIKEAGYDFSPLCEKFFVEDNHGMRFIYRDIGTLKDIAFPPGYGPEHGYTVSVPHAPEILPIIPYPVLEACLPEIDPYEFISVQGKVYIIKPVNFHTCTTDLSSTDWEIDLSELIHRDCGSPVQAFLWCIENYPDETLARFEELIDGKEYLESKGAL